MLSPFASPLYVMAKPVGSICNLACKYCYYLEKGALYNNGAYEAYKTYEPHEANKPHKPERRTAR